MGFFYKSFFFLPFYFSFLMLLNFVFNFFRFEFLQCLQRVVSFGHRPFEKRENLSSILIHAIWPSDTLTLVGYYRCTREETFACESWIKSWELHFLKIIFLKTKETCKNIFYYLWTAGKNLVLHCHWKWITGENCRPIARCKVDDKKIKIKKSMKKFQLDWQFNKNVKRE